MPDPYQPITTEARLSFPLHGTVYTTRRRVPAEKLLPVVGESVASELGSAWSDSILLSATMSPGAGTEKTLTLVHARIPSESQQSWHNWEYSTCSIGGQQFPSVQQTIILKAAEISASSPEPGSAMPTVSGQIFHGAGYILVDRQISNSGLELEPAFRVERRNDVLRSISRQVGVDSLNGKPLGATTELYHANEEVLEDTTAAALFATPGASFWGLQDDGRQRTGTQLSCAWYSITTEQTIGGDYGGGIVDVGSYTTNEPFYWPPVLKTFELLTWERKDGGEEIYPVVKFEPDAYEGPCKNEVTLTWKRTKHTIAPVVPMKPTPIHYSSPYYSLNIPACLHGLVECKCDTGNSDPIYKANTGSLKQFPATNQVEWPSGGLLAYDDQEPFRGGYLRTTRTVYPP